MSKHAAQWHTVLFGVLRTAAKSVVDCSSFTFASNIAAQHAFAHCPYCIKLLPDSAAWLVYGRNDGLFVAGGKVLKVAHHTEGCKTVKTCKCKMCRWHNALTNKVQARSLCKTP